MRNLRLTIEYDGTAYAGWQLQKDRPTLQGAIEQAIAQVTGERVRLAGAGRTDAGVHARGQVASYRTESALADWKLLRALNATTPPDIAILAVEEAEPAFHARKSARSKRYSYTVQRGIHRPALDRHRVVPVHLPLDLEAMRAAAFLLAGRHDFRAFQGAGSPRVRTVRDLSRLELVEEGPRLVFHLEADGFLYKMCRNLVGTLLEVGRGERDPAGMTLLLATGDRRRVGATAPPHGLVLEEVRY